MQRLSVSRAPLFATTYVAFLRAVNVGGRVVKMDALKKIFEALGLKNVATFIASGNVIFDSTIDPARLEARIEKGLKEALGYDVGTMVRSSQEVRAVLETVARQKLQHGNGTTLYVGFLKKAPPAAGALAVAALSNEVDLLRVVDRELYWQCRKSFGESTIAGARLDRVVNVPVTMRNFNTVQRIAAKFD